MNGPFCAARVEMAESEYCIVNLFRAGLDLIDGVRPGFVPSKS